MYFWMFAVHNIDLTETRIQQIHKAKYCLQNIVIQLYLIDLISIMNFINPLTPMSDHDRISLNNINDRISPDNITRVYM